MFSIKFRVPAVEMFKINLSKYPFAVQSRIKHEAQKATLSYVYIRLFLPIT